MNKLTDAEVVKALECCIGNTNCGECPLFRTPKCMNKVFGYTLDLINRQKAEIENNAQCTIQNSQLLEVLREKCNEHQDFHKGDDGVFRGWISMENLDRVIDEM